MSFISHAFDTLFYAHFVICVAFTAEIKKHVQNSVYPYDVEPPAYNIESWVRELHLQQCAFVEVGDKYYAIFVETRPRRYDHEKEIKEYFLGLCDFDTLSNWSICSPELMKKREDDCSFEGNKMYESRVHRRFCDITLLTQNAPQCDCNSELSDTKLFKVQGFPTCFKAPLPESLCGDNNVCGLAACIPQTINNRVYTASCDRRCKHKQPFCEIPGRKSSAPRAIRSFWTDWSNPFCTDVSCASQYDEATCINRETGDGDIDCLGPGTSCCTADLQNCRCHVYAEDGTAKVFRTFSVPQPELVEYMSEEDFINSIPLKYLNKEEYHKYPYSPRSVRATFGQAWKQTLTDIYDRRLLKFGNSHKPGQHPLRHLKHALMTRHKTHEDAKKKRHVDIIDLRTAPEPSTTTTTKPVIEKIKPIEINIEIRTEAAKNVSDSFLELALLKSIHEFASNDNNNIASASDLETTTVCATTRGPNCIAEQFPKQVDDCKNNTDNKNNIFKGTCFTKRATTEGTNIQATTSVYEKLRGIVSKKFGSKNHSAAQKEKSTVPDEQKKVYTQVSKKSSLEPDSKIGKEEFVEEKYVQKSDEKNNIWRYGVLKHFEDDENAKSARALSSNSCPHKTDEDDPEDVSNFEDAIDNKIKDDAENENEADLATSKLVQPIDENLSKHPNKVFVLKHLNDNYDENDNQTPTTVAREEIAQVIARKIQPPINTNATEDEDETMTKTNWSQVFLMPTPMPIEPLTQIQMKTTLISSAPSLSKSQRRAAVEEDVSDDDEVEEEDDDLNDDIAIEYAEPDPKEKIISVIEAVEEMISTTATTTKASISGVCASQSSYFITVTCNLVYYFLCNIL